MDELRRTIWIQEDGEMQSDMRMIRAGSTISAVYLYAHERIVFEPREMAMSRWADDGGPQP